MDDLATRRCRQEGRQQHQAGHGGEPDRLDGTDGRTTSLERGGGRLARDLLLQRPEHAREGEDQRPDGLELEVLRRCQPPGHHDKEQQAQAAGGEERDREQAELALGPGSRGARGEAQPTDHARAEEHAEGRAERSHRDRLARRRAAPARTDAGRQAAEDARGRGGARERRRPRPRPRRRRRARRRAARAPARGRRGSRRRTWCRGSSTGATTTRGRSWRGGCTAPRARGGCPRPRRPYAAGGCRRRRGWRRRSATRTRRPPRAAGCGAPGRRRCPWGSGRSRRGRRRSAGGCGSSRATTPW